MRTQVRVVLTRSPKELVIKHVTHGQDGKVSRQVHAWAVMLHAPRLSWPTCSEQHSDLCRNRWREKREEAEQNKRDSAVGKARLPFLPMRYS